MTDTAANLAARFLEARDTVTSTMRMIAESVQAVLDEDEEDSSTANDRLSHHKAHNRVFKDCISKVCSSAKTCQI